jgi:hypothetical protein
MAADNYETREYIPDGVVTINSAWTQNVSQPEGRDLPIQSASLSVPFNHQLSLLQNHHAEYSLNQ